MSTPSINTDVIDNTTSYNISNIENAPPETSKSSTSQKSFKGYAQPLSPRPININIANTTQSPSGGGSVSFHPDTRQNYNNLHQQQLSSSSQSSTRYKDQIFQLNLEIQSLKQRLSLTSSTSKNELLDLLSEKDAVIGNKSRQISALNDKFNKITKAVNGMEREMKTLRKAKKDADDECKKINRYLGIREKEVNVLVSRCAAQEEKLNEMKSSRMLEKELSALRKMKDKQMDDHGKEIKGLMGDLQQLGNEKQALKNEILSLEEKNIVVQEELDATKAEVQQKCDKISSLYDELKGLHESKEKESTDCIAMRKNLQDVKHELFERESELDELETVHKNEINRLRREIENRTASGEESLEKYRAMKEVEFDNLKRDLQSKQLEFEHTMDDLKHCRRKHETVQKELTALEMKQDTLSLLTKQEAEANENERISLENQLTEKNKELQELEGFNRELKDENESNAMQMKKLKEKLGFLENEIREMTEKEMSVIESQNEKMSTIYKLEENIQQLKEVRSCIKFEIA
jgi:chromosome segregation ATPase